MMDFLRKGTASGLIVSLLLSVVPTGAAGASAESVREPEPALTPFEAVYRVRAFGLGSGESVLRLAATSDPGVYEFQAAVQPTGVTRLMLDPQSECSRFRVTDGELRPIHYRNDDKEDPESMDFDRDEGIVTASYKDQEVELALEPNALDPATEQVAALHDLYSAEAAIGPYRTISRNRYREVEYHPEGNERIETPLGTYHTVKFRRQRVGSSRSVLIWYAPKLDWIPVQIQHFKREKSQAMARLTSYQPGASADQARGSVTPLCP